MDTHFVRTNSWYSTSTKMYLYVPCIIASGDRKWEPWTHFLGCNLVEGHRVEPPLDAEFQQVWCSSSHFPLVPRSGWNLQWFQSHGGFITHSQHKVWRVKQCRERNHQGKGKSTCVENHLANAWATLIRVWCSFYNIKWWRLQVQSSRWISSMENNFEL